MTNLLRELAPMTTTHAAAAAFARDDRGPLPEAPRVLLLGGTSEGRQLAACMAERCDVIAISSLAGRVIEPSLPQGLVRVGGFGGLDGLVHYLRTENIVAVIDATHPFAVRISKNAEAACRQLSVPLIALSRPPWEQAAGDIWHEVPDLSAAAAFVDLTHTRVLLSIGRQEIGAFADCATSTYLIRAIEQPPPPLPLHHTVILQRGPFAMEDELKLLRRHRIDMIVSKQSGGAATYAKIAAARQLGVPVVMIMRPQKHTERTVSSVAEAISHLVRLLASHSSMAAGRRAAKR